MDTFLSANIMPEPHHGREKPKKIRCLAAMDLRERPFSRMDGLIRTMRFNGIKSVCFRFWNMSGTCDLAFQWQIEIYAGSIRRLLKTCNRRLMCTGSLIGQLP